MTSIKPNLAGYCCELSKQKAILLGSFSIKKPYICFVEGKDDCLFIGKILSDMNIDPSNVEIIPADGIGNFGKMLGLLMESSPFREGSIKKCAVILDSDQDALSRKSIGKILRKWGDESPQQDNSIHCKWHVLGPNDSRIGLGVYLMPDGGPGDLESLCLQTIEETEHGKMVKAFIENAQKVVHNGNKYDHLSKRTVLAYLATKPGERCTGVGMAYKKGHFETTHSCLDPLKAFLCAFVDRENICTESAS